MLVDLEIFKSQVIRPDQSEGEFLINKHLVYDNFGIDSWELRFNEIDDLDEFRRMQIFQGYLQNNVMTVNEVRRELSLPPKKGGDRAFRITPLGIVFLDEMEDLTTGDVSAKPGAPLDGQDQGGTSGGRPQTKDKTNYSKVLNWLRIGGEEDYV